ncbi:hypothetical protein J2TS4_33820 [Paenibacillus sp. J2TS4]|nr:hypothetical protein J2TS4_33820 [Paenibacillus sp. J2TS4]
MLRAASLWAQYRFDFDPGSVSFGLVLFVELLLDEVEAAQQGDSLLYRYSSDSNMPPKEQQDSAPSPVSYRPQLAIYAKDTHD